MGRESLGVGARDQEDRGVNLEKICEAKEALDWVLARLKERKGTPDECKVSGVDVFRLRRARQALSELDDAIPPNVDEGRPVEPFRSDEAPEEWAAIADWENKRADHLSAKLAEAQADGERMRQALRPFAEAHAFYEPDYFEHEPDFRSMLDDNLVLPVRRSETEVLVRGDFARAREAIVDVPKGGDKAYFVLDAGFDRLTRALDDLVRAGGSAEAVVDEMRTLLALSGMGGWISVKDRYPENGQEVIFVVEAGDEDYAGSVQKGHYHRYQFNDGVVDHEFSFPSRGTRASYWMPAPEAPVVPAEGEKS